MFFLSEGGRLVPTRLQSRDRIRIRPKINKFFIWRPVRGLWTRRAIRLWMPDGTGAYCQWLEIPAKRNGGDVFQRIMDKYGADNFGTPELRWMEERPTVVLDGRFDYVAI